LYAFWGDLCLADPQQDLDAAYRAYNYALKLASAGHSDRMRQAYRDVRRHLNSSLGDLLASGSVNTSAASRLHNRLLREAQGEQPELASNLNRSGIS
jgi:hypothetical protein